MISLNGSEFVLKVISSILFRIIVVVYSIFLLIFNHSVFSWLIYGIIISLYLFIYYYLLKWNKHFLRTLNDYIFIFLILFDKNILDISNVILLLFPLFNSPNHLNHTRSPMLLLFLTVTTFLSIYALHNNLDMGIIIYLIGFLFLTLIGFFELIRRATMVKLLKIYEKIDASASEKNFSNFHLNKIYAQAIEGIDSVFGRHNNVDMIIGFIRSKNNHLSIRSTSRFILKYDVDELNKQSLSVKNAGINIRVILDNKIYDNTLYINVSNYVFLITLKKKIGIFGLFYIIVAYEIIAPILKKISKILDFDSSLNKQKYDNTKKLNADLHYVNDVVKSIHFLKNKFTPIKTYFKLLEKFELVEEKKKPELLKIIADTKARAIISLNAIESKTLQVLDKTNSPFSSYSMKKIKYKHIYMLVKNIWIENFSEETINILCSPDDMEKFCPSVNRNLLEFLLTDIIENIRKYSSGQQSLIFDYDDYVKITLQNEVRDASKKKNELSELVDQFNNLDRVEINRRNSFGLVHIIELSELLHIDCKLSFSEQKYFTTTLTFKGYKNE